MLTTLFCAAAMLFASEVDQQPPPSNAQVVGRVVDADSKAPVAGARVMLAPVRGPGSPITPMTPASTSTDNRGRFAFDGIRAGRFRVTVRKPGYVFDPLNAPIVDLQPGQSSSLDIALPRGAVLAGRILDQQGEPLPDMRVSALRRMPDRGDDERSRRVPGVRFAAWRICADGCCAADRSIYQDVVGAFIASSDLGANVLSGYDKSGRRSDRGAPAG
jgi:Carboxypeptidase regulatory-like domain